MKNVKTICAAVSTLAAVAVLVSGCADTGVSLKMKAAGEINMTGVSKIALVGFNALPDDPFTGVVAADAETVGLVERAVSSAFYRVPTYQVASLTDEQAIAALQEGARPDKRYDGLVYGRVWWQMTPEGTGTYPEKFTLSHSRNVPYVAKVFGKEIPSMAQVLTQTHQEVRMLPYRQCTATLMLALSFYRLDSNGNLSKITDTYEVTESGFLLKAGIVNGAASKAGRKIDKSGRPVLTVDSNGKVVLTQRTVTMPTELQAKLSLVAKVTGDLAAKVAPSEKLVVAPWGLDTVGLSGRRNFDSKLTELFATGAWSALKSYCVYTIRQKVGQENADKLVSIKDEPANYVVPKAKKTFKANETEDFNEYLADEDVHVYLYAYGLACEAAGDTDGAMDAYTDSFAVKPDENAASGLGRCNEAQSQSERLARVNNAKKKADKKASMK